MLLTGRRKRMLQEAVTYYHEVTNNDYDKFVLDAANTQPELQETESVWLAKKLMLRLQAYEITLRDCLENKDVMNTALEDNTSRKEGEFYTPEVWAEEGRKYLKEMLGDLWGKAYIWDASCGTGNLLRTIDYPKEKIFQSSLLEKDVELIVNSGEGFLADQVFQLDFLNDIDWDDYNMDFSNKLPDKLREVFENNEPIVFFMNPPYRAGASSSTDVGSYMSARGLSRCAVDILHHFFYRMLMFKDRYNLTNLYMGIYSPITLYQSKMLEPLYDLLREDHVFDGGMSFTASTFTNTTQTVDWAVVYAQWKPRGTQEGHVPFELDTKILDKHNQIIKLGVRPDLSNEDTINVWTQPRDYGTRRFYTLPNCTTFDAFSGRGKAVEGALGYTMISNSVIRSLRQCCITTMPNSDNCPIIEENFWRAVVSFGARRIYNMDLNAYDNAQYFKSPDETVEGYKVFEANMLVLFLFDNSAHHSSYRNVQYEGGILNINNPCFPVAQEHVRQIVTDENILQDMDTFQGDNAFILDAIQSVSYLWTPEAQDFYNYCMQMLAKSLTDRNRSNLGYDKWTVAWDAGLWQLRNLSTGSLFTPEEDEEYMNKLRTLRKTFYEDIYKYKFVEGTIDRELYKNIIGGK